jgi:hypothetical protein
MILKIFQDYPLFPKQRFVQDNFPPEHRSGYRVPSLRFGIAKKAILH